MNKEIKSLYRRLRPTEFSEVVGQIHIVKTLENQIKSGKISHAYLFCGTRGTGKTSLARIFAKEIKGEIIELDAASNNSVDDVRELTEKVKYPPVLGNYKVYIIDEVHMFSTSAFNSFLKTLEEPPSHSIFVLCTTEPHKLPQTILSRVLRFDFRPIPSEELHKFIENTFKKEGVLATDEVIKTLVDKSGGSVRDLLSIAEVITAYSNKPTMDDVERILGTVSGNKLKELVNAIVIKDVEKIENINKEIFSQGVNVFGIIKDLLRIIKGMFIEKKDERLLKIFQRFAELELSIKTSMDQKSMFEACCYLCMA
ncbi:MAG: DNA polymerase III subunit gamma/tau [Firmicutes bacterium]|nr:DNA polymerase III subunit gamma/tau [Bacillota bacterium]